MYSFLLRKALPFTLTFIFGATLGAIGGLFGSSEKKTELVLGTRTYDYGGRCRTRRQRLVAESKSLDILEKPSVRSYPVTGGRVRVNVTFGADGKVQNVEHLQPLLPETLLKEVEQAARQIRFTPEVINSVPVTVEREVEINIIPVN